MAETMLTLLSAPAGISLLDAIQGLFTAPDRRPVALLTGPRLAKLAQVGGDGTLHHPDGLIGWSEILEARVFDGVTSLRWLRRSSSASDGAAVTVGSGRPATWSVQQIACDLVVDRPQLFWGKCKSSGGGWSTLHDNRVGTLKVPLALRPGERARLAMKAYFTSDPEIDGNLRLIATCPERLEAN